MKNIYSPHLYIENIIIYKFEYAYKTMHNIIYI